MKDFKDIAYLKQGKSKQQKAYQSLIELKIFEELKIYSPILTGTIPIEIDIDDSDLDIICYCKDLNQFKSDITSSFRIHKEFEINQKTIRNQKTIVARFVYNGFLIEIFGQNRPTEEQEAYRHMLIEHKILQEKGEIFKQQIIELKKQGYKTEPAFAKLLGLNGDPYNELLKLGEYINNPKGFENL